MKPAVYPDSFFIAHRLFTGGSLPAGGEWGDILDGPVIDEDSLIEGIIEKFRDIDYGPSRADLRVWHIVPGKPAEDCTNWVITLARNTLMLQWAL